MKWLIEDRRQAYKELESECDTLNKSHCKTIGKFCVYGHQIYMKPLHYYAKRVLDSYAKTLLVNLQTLTLPMRLLWNNLKEHPSYLKEFTASDTTLQKNVCQSCIAIINFEIKKLIYNESINENIAEAEKALKAQNINVKVTAATSDQAAEISQGGHAYIAEQFSDDGDMALFCPGISRNKNFFNRYFPSYSFMITDIPLETKTKHKQWTPQDDSDVITLPLGDIFFASSVMSPKLLCDLPYVWKRALLAERREIYISCASHLPPKGLFFHFRYICTCSKHPCEKHEVVVKAKNMSKRKS